MSATSFFGGEFFGGEFFNSGGVPDVVKTGTGGIDPGDGQRRRPYKPTGLLHLPKKDARKEVSDRIDESREIQAEISERLAREFTDENALIAEQERQLEIAQMSEAQIDAEIGLLLKRKMREEEELFMLLLMASVAVS